MSKDTLLIDAGNSAVKWVLSSAVNQSGMAKKIYVHDINVTFFTELWAQMDKPEKVIVSCVANDDIWNMLNKACRQLWSVDVERVLAIKEGFGLANAYVEPSKLGSDRWCAMIGAYHEVKSDFMVVDCGTAITIDIVSGTGDHAGGYILPGLTMMKNSLTHQAAEVKLDIDTLHDSLAPANTTTACVNAAVYLAAVKLIETVFEQQSGQTKKIQCVLTGGDAALVAKLLSIKYVMMPDCVLRGLAYIAKLSGQDKSNQEFLL